MPVFNNISEVLNFVGGDARFMEVSLPYGFNHWSEGARQLQEDNPQFFQDRPSIQAAEQSVGVLASVDEDGEHVVRGWMAIFPGSRYVCSDWKKRRGTKTSVAQVDLLGIAIRKGLLQWVTA